VKILGIVLVILAGLVLAAWLGLENRLAPEITVDGITFPARVQITHQTGQGRRL
jgi:putative effector of murein hydrolase